MTYDDHELDSLLVEARELIDAQIAAERRQRGPDFCAVIEAAHARGLVDDDALDEAGQLAPVVELGVEADGAAALALDNELDAMLAAARSEAEADVAARRLAGIPPLRAITAEPPPARELGGWVMAVGLAAVVIGLIIAVPRLLESFVSGNYDEARPNANQSEYLRWQDTPEQRLEEQPQPLPRQQLPAPTSHEAIIHDAARPRAGHTQPRARSERSEETASTSTDVRVIALEAQARAHWQAGELAQAEAAYRQIIALAGRSRHADLAYGDLFTLAHQRGDAAAESALWHDYLQAFPHGRFAEDAWAGSCRRASADVRARCWQDYLQDFPQGLHAAAAAKVLGEDAP